MRIPAKDRRRVMLQIQGEALAIYHLAYVLKSYDWRDGPVLKAHPGLGKAVARLSRAICQVMSAAGEATRKEGA